MTYELKRKNLPHKIRKRRSYALLSSDLYVQKQILRFQQSGDKHLASPTLTMCHVTFRV